MNGKRKRDVAKLSIFAHYERWQTKYMLINTTRLNVDHRHLMPRFSANRKKWLSFRFSSHFMCLLNAITINNKVAFLFNFQFCIKLYSALCGFESIQFSVHIPQTVAMEIWVNSYRRPIFSNQQQKEIVLVPKKGIEISSYRKKTMKIPTENV